MKLELGDLLIRLSQFGWQLRTQNMLSNIANSENRINSVLEEVNQMFEKKWEPNKIQAVFSTFIHCIVVILTIFCSNVFFL